ncbi:SH3 domain-containing protein [Streptomyces sp. NPDC058739]|uniref:SH3 domain-containing protein n=1 Tax=Streptomyces sp. NPDC058739 TaxID=3346618 RepID=UPI003681636C
MRTTPALRTLTAALLAGGTLAVAAAGTLAAAATPPAYADGQPGAPGDGSHDPIWGTVVSRTDLNLRQEPTTHAPVVGSLSPGSQDRVQCKVIGQSVNGNPYWYWLVGAQAWASAAFVETDRHHVPTCADPCPRWKDGEWTNWDDPFWNDSWSASGSSSWSVSGTGTGTGSGSWSVSGSWSWSVSGASSGGWD